MNAFLLVLIFAAAVIAEDDIDWSTVKRIDIRLPAPFDMDQAICNSRIVGGTEATPHSIPYQVGLLIYKSDGTYFCGGSLISTNYVLTAAHCVEGATKVEARLGAHKIMDDEAATQQRSISTVFTIHSDWNTDTLENDIAVVKLPYPAALNEYVQLVTLPCKSDASNTYTDDLGRISGWGLDSDLATTISEVLRQVFATIISNSICNFSYLNEIKPSHICTSGKCGKGSCSGDSGGPLVASGRQVGIVSFGIVLGCERGWPSAFTRVTSYLDWIATTTDVTIQP